MDSRICSLGEGIPHTGARLDCRWCNGRVWGFPNVIEHVFKKHRQCLSPLKNFSGEVKEVTDLCGPNDHGPTQMVNLEILQYF